MNYLETRPWKTGGSDFPLAFSAWLVAKTLKYDLPVRTLIDWGVGSGDFKKAFEILGFGVTGFDLLPVSEDIIEADFTKPIRMKGLKGHVSVCRNVFEHLQDPTNLIAGIKANMDRDGIAVIAVPDWRTYAPIFYADHTHVRPYDRVSLPNLMREHGFEVLEVEEMIQYPPAWESMFVRSLAEIVRHVVPLRLARAIGRFTGWSFWEWACLRTVVVICKIKE